MSLFFKEVNFHVAKVVIEPNIECSSLIHLILFQTQAKFKLDNLFKLHSFIF
jgi:hypothetical protein